MLPVLGVAAVAVAVAVAGADLQYGARCLNALAQFARSRKDPSADLTSSC